MCVEGLKCSHLVLAMLPLENQAWRQSLPRPRMFANRGRNIFPRSVIIEGKLSPWRTGGWFF